MRRLVMAVPLPTTVILSIASADAQHLSITDMPYKQTVTVANSWLGPGYGREANSASTPLTSIQGLHPLCRWRDKFRQLD
ncbi:hypothetical protein Zmor_012889 [Zophobas morio]|uniref:Uncharacterized protein n=1 Tax=Zophobas morio TaxID=2755281 RepID=A0AA38ICT9_9CUCU|nr:hypothetical protein Zmor_012889 [Zophobas morio]